MGYSTQYGTSRYDNSPKQRKHRNLYCAILLAAVMILLQLLFPKQLNAVKEAFFPVFSQEVRSSISDMAASVRNGKDLSTAAAVFCQEIIDAAHN